MIRTYTTRLRATLLAAGLFVAMSAQPGRAGDEPAPLPMAPVPSISGYVPPAPAGSLLAPVPTAAVPSTGAVVSDGSAGMVHGEQILSGGLGYITSSSCGPGCTSSMWYWSADFLWLQRDIDNPRTFINAQLPDGSIFSTRIADQDFGYDPAMRVTVGRALVECSACDLFVEGTYFGLHHANIGRDTVAVPGVTLFGSPLQPLFDVTLAQTMTYVSDLHSGEVNLKWDYYVDNTLYLLLGVRYIRFDDRLKLNEAGLLAAGPAFLPQGFQNVRVTNNMIGLQIGFDYQTRDLASRWTLNTYGRAGLYANVLDGDLEQGANASTRGPFLNEFHPGRLQMSGALEAGIVSSYKITPGLSIRAGYHVLWLGAIGLATDQPTPDLTDGRFNGRLSNNQDVFFYGPFAGLEYHWGCCR